MILSRFWYLLLTAAALMGFAAALLTQGLVNNHYRTATVNDLVRDRFEVEQTLRIDARSRLDAIAPIAAHADVRGALRRASARREPAIDEEISEPLRQQLQQLNTQLDQMAGDLLFAVDKDGWIVAAIAPTAPPSGAGLGQFPLVQRALEGYVRDDVWVYNDSVYRMAARPVVEGGQYVGAIVHGKRYDDQLAELLSQRLDGASVAFFQGTQPFAGYMADAAPRRDDMGRQLATVLSNERFLEGNRTDPIELETGGLAVYSSVTGSARHAQVGYAIGRPVTELETAWAVFDQAGGDAWAGLPWPILGGGAFLVFLLAMLWMWVERDRPLGKLRKHAAVLKESPENRLTITDFGGRYRKIAHSINEALDEVAAAGGAGAPKKAANLDELLGPTEAAPGSGSFFGFAGGDAAGEPADIPDVPDAAPAPPGPAGGLPSPGTPAGGLPPIGGPSAAPRPPTPKKPPAPPRPPAPGGGAKPPPPRPPTPAKQEAPDDEFASPGSPEEAKTAIAVPPRSSKKKLKSTLMGVAPPDEDDDDDDGDEATMVASIPKELLERSASGQDEEQAHFREVYEKFVAMKETCGEPTAKLTFEKFAVTLRKNRDQIVNRHGAKRVRFTVYEKNGKAALKATPIKD